MTQNTYVEQLCSKKTQSEHQKVFKYNERPAIQVLLPSGYHVLSFSERLLTSAPFETFLCFPFSAKFSHQCLDSVLTLLPQSLGEVNCSFGCSPTPLLPSAGISCVPRFRQKAPGAF